MQRDIRYQGVVIRQDHILLIQHCEHHSGRNYWVLPGGGREEGESEEACLRREMQEETGLEVRVERLLLDEPAPQGDTYNRHRIYLCTPVSGQARPGYEPEHLVDGRYSIGAVGWFDLRDAACWGREVNDDPITYPALKRIQAILGYN